MYAALTDGRIDSEWLRRYLAQQVPSRAVWIFPLDGSPEPRPRARVLEDQQYIYQTSSDANGDTVTVGYPYSLLEWCIKPHTSWSPPIDVRRVLANQIAQAIGATQIWSLAENRQACQKALDIVATDGKDSHCGFLRSVKDLRWSKSLLPQQKQFDLRLVKFQSSPRPYVGYLLFV